MKLIKLRDLSFKELKNVKEFVFGKTYLPLLKVN